jgi:beta-lactam-binding protein with PASTA domain
MKFFRFLISKVFFKNLLYAIVVFIIIVLGTLLWLRLYTHHGKERSVPDFTGMTLEEAEITARKNKLMYKIIDSVYTNVVNRGTVYEQNPKARFKVKKWRTVFLTINAFKPEMVKMPNLIGLTYRQAKAILETNGLEVGKLSYVPDLAINNVMEQKLGGEVIEQYEFVEKGASIDLVLGKGLSNETTLAPYIISLSFEEAKQKILDASLNPGAFIFDETVKNKKDSSNAIVWKQNPEFDVKNPVQLGSPVYIWLTIDSSKLLQPDTLSVIQYEFDE